jgi:hypothetical protein
MKFKKMMHLWSPLFGIAPLVLVVMSFAIASYGSSRGIQIFPQCSLPWPYVAFSYVPSIISVLLVIIGCAWFLIKKQLKKLWLQLIVTMICLILAFGVNVMLTLCM